MKKAVAYIRVSTDQQADSGLGLEVQQAKVRAMAEVQGVELIELIVDAGESAKSLKRPGAQRLLALVDAGEVDTVIIYKLDRLTRSVRDLGDLLERFERRSVALVSVSESLDTATAAGRLVLNVMGSVSQWEREVIGERTREALQIKKAKGERVGTIPFGYQLSADGNLLEEHAGERQILSAISRLRQKGNTLREIALALNAKGWRTRTGAEWKIRKVHHLLSPGVN